METPRDLTNTAEKAAKSAQQVAQHAGQELRERFEDGKEEMRAMYARTKERANQAMDISQDFVKEHPISTVLGAAAIGFVAGALLSRTRH